MPPPERRDDPSVSDNERLWRRVHPSDIIRDSESEELRPTSAAFRPSEEMSVDIASLTTPEAVLSNYPHHSLIEFTAGIARKEGGIVVRDPLPDNPSHALICGKNPEGRLTKSQAKKIQQSSMWVILKTP